MLTIGYSSSAKPHIFNAGEVLLTTANEPADIINAAIRSSDNLMELFSTLYSYRQNTSKVFIPYFPYSRADRKEAGNGVNGFDLVATLLNNVLSLRTDIYTLELHNPYAIKYVSFPVNIGVEKLLPYYKSLDPNQQITIVIPDKGALDRGTRVQKALGIPDDLVIKCGKTRDINGNLNGFSLQEIGDNALTSNHYMIVDDIIDNGGTFTLVAKALREKLKDKPYSIISVLAPHCLLKKKSDDDLTRSCGIDGIDFIFTTNSLRDFNSPKFMEVLDLTNEELVKNLLNI